MEGTGEQQVSFLKKFFERYFFFRFEFSSEKWDEIASSFFRAILFDSEL